MGGVGAGRGLDHKAAKGNFLVHAFGQAQSVNKNEFFCFNSIIIFGEFGGR